MKLKRILVIGILFIAMLMSVACSQQGNQQGEGTTKAAGVTNKALSGEINIDGSSTVYPITAAVAEEFALENRNVKVSVGFAGTGGGMKKFYAGQIDICDASRPIKQSEIEEVKKAGIEYTEFKVAYDGLSIVVNKDNDWVKTLTVEQLKTMWEPDSKIKNWSDIDPSWPNEPIKFYAPGTDSGTFEYFTEAVNEKAGAIRTDITPSEDDNVLVTGVANDKNAIGFFGYAYYLENKDQLKVVPVDGGKGPVEPSFDTIKDGSYSPLSRPLFIYVNNSKLAEDHVKEFVKYYLTEGRQLVADVGYVALEDSAYETELAKIK